jgi:ketosteroid isomerase-like protein
MSQENVEIVRTSIEAYNRRDFDTAVQSFDTEIEWLFPPVLAGESCRGPEEVRRLWEGLDEAFEDFQLEPQEFVDAGDLVVVRSHFHGRGKESGIETEGRMHSVTALRDGRIVRIEYFNDWAEALEAAGLSE